MKHSNSNLGLFDAKEGHPYFLPHGEELLKSLIDKWREMHTEMGFHFLHTFTPLSPLKMHMAAFRKGAGEKLASLGPSDADFVTIFCKKGEVFQELISSLQFLEQTIKIFGFETRVYLVGALLSPQALLLKKGLEESGFSFREEPSAAAPRVEFRLKGSKGAPPYVTVVEEGKNEIVCRSFFGSCESWMELLVEQSNRSCRV